MAEILPSLFTSWFANLNQSVLKDSSGDTTDSRLSVVPGAIWSMSRGIRPLIEAGLSAVKPFEC